MKDTEKRGTHTRGYVLHPLDAELLLSEARIQTTEPSLRVAGMEIRTNPHLPRNLVCATDARGKVLGVLKLQEGADG